MKSSRRLNKAEKGYQPYAEMKKENTRLLVSKEIPDLDRIER